MGITDIPRRFRVEGTPGLVVPYGSGHIHDTYRVHNQESGCPDYLLQCMNEEVFRDVPGMMKNISLVTTHLRHRLSDSSSVLTSLTLVPASDGSSWLRHDGRAWRMYEFLGGLQSYDSLEEGSLVRECGRGYGQFARLIADLSPDELSVTIPGFHDIALRLHQLGEVREKAATGVETACLEIVDRLAPAMTALERKEVPHRITHNDTKCNNILFDPEGRAACVVDLDTVMPGKIWYDTGDSLRSLMTDLPEDAPVEHKIELRTDYYRAYLEGYLGETGEVLREEELECIPLSGAYMAFIMGVRFLTDHLGGDVYYKTRFRGHNLLRATNQLTLAGEIESRHESLAAILREVMQENT